MSTKEDCPNCGRVNSVNTDRFAVCFACRPQIIATHSRKGNQELTLCGKPLSRAYLAFDKYEPITCSDCQAINRGEIRE